MLSRSVLSSSIAVLLSCDVIIGMHYIRNHIVGMYLFVNVVATNYGTYVAYIMKFSSTFHLEADPRSEAAYTRGCCTRFHCNDSG